VTSVTVVPAGQADQTTAGSPATTTTKSGSLQTAGASRMDIGAIGGAAFGLMGMFAMAAL